MKNPPADAQDHQQGEAVDLHVAQGGLPGRNQLINSWPVAESVAVR